MPDLEGRRFPTFILALILLLVGAFLLFGGLYLIVLGGSWYYALAGAAIFAAGVLVFGNRIGGVWLYLAVVALSVVWALWEVGFSFWGLVPRLVAPLVLAAIAIFLIPFFPGSDGRPRSARRWRLAGGVMTLGLVLFIGLMFRPHDVFHRDFAAVPGKISAATAVMGPDWLSFGRTGTATRFAPLDQINTANVGSLRQAWVTSTGDIAEGSQNEEEQNTPLYADGRLFHCSPIGTVSALKPSTGDILWQFHPIANSTEWKRCRTLGYVDPGPGDACGPRVVMTTVDRRLIALRAEDGKPCESFGKDGTVDLSVGLGDKDLQYYVPNTGPFVMADKIVVAGRVSDNVMVNEPSGVIRAFDAKTGALAWAWDLGNPAITKEPPEGETYTPGTPNVWSSISYDTDLGLLYLPLGNATPDFYGGKRRPFDEDYNPSVVALDIATGREKWHYQTVHHDIWDYDLPASPTLFDLPDGKGGTVPALAQITKHGHIFVLDRRTGEPLVETSEMPAPQGDGKVTGEYYSKTQPVPVGMPGIGNDLLTEARMWGATPLDQMLCRILFRKYRHEGLYTPHSTDKTVIWPGNGGGMNWGGAAYDEVNNLLIVNDMRFPIVTQLLPRAEVGDDLATIAKLPGVYPQLGLPYSLKLGPFFSPLGIPCMQPPYGTITGIDMASRKIIWQRPAGTTRDVTLGGVQPGLPFYIGMPTLGGPIATGGGLVFHAGTQDYYLRAYDVKSGALLWEGRLPTGAQATPMTFTDKDTGRQFVVVTAGGARDNPSDRSDYIVAFALPE